MVLVLVLPDQSSDCRLKVESPTLAAGGLVSGRPLESELMEFLGDAA